MEELASDSAARRRRIRCLNQKDPNGPFQSGRSESLPECKTCAGNSRGQKRAEALQTQRARAVAGLSQTLLRFRVRRLQRRRGSPSPLEFGKHLAEQLLFCLGLKVPLQARQGRAAAASNAEVSARVKPKAGSCGRSALGLH